MTSLFFNEKILYKLRFNKKLKITFLFKDVIFISERKMKIYKFRFLLIALTYFLQLNSLSAQNKDSLYIAGNYHKAEYRILMRDGIKLFTIVYSPKDTTHDYPVLFNRTPYSIAPYGINDYPKSLGPSKYFAKEKYIFVYQDVRGRFMSEGKYEDVRPFIPDKKSAKDSMKAVMSMIQSTGL